MRRVHFPFSIILMSLTVWLGCSKELPFPETEEAIEESVTMTMSIEASAREILESAFGDGGDMNLKKLTKQLKKIDGVIDADLYEEDDLIAIKQKDGVYINVFLDSFRESGDEETEPEDETALSVLALAPTRSSVEIEGETALVTGETGKALLLAPMYSEDLQAFEEEWGTDGRVYGTQLYQSMLDYLKGCGFSVLPLQDTDASFNMFAGKNLTGYDAVVILSEGKKKAVFKDGKATAIRTGTTIQSVQGPGTIGTQFVFYTDDDHFLLKYDEYSIGMVKGGTYYYFSAPKLLEDDCTFKDSWILAGASYSATKSDLSDAFFKGNAGAYTGFDGSVGRMESLSLSSYMTAMMCMGVELDVANEMTKDHATDIDGDRVSGRKRLTSLHRSDSSKFYLYDSTPFNLTATPEGNKTIRLSWSVHPSIAERVCEVFVGDESVMTGRVGAEPDKVYSISYYPKRTGPHDWHVVSRIQSGSGPVLATFTSRYDSFDALSVLPLNITPSALDFEPLQFGDDPVSKWFVIKNAGEEDIVIESIGHSGGSFSISFDILPRTLHPGDFMKVSATFQPTDLGLQTDEVVIRSGQETYTVPLSGTCVYDGELMCVRDDWENPLTVIEMGEVELGKEKKLNIRLANVSPMTLRGDASLGTSDFVLDLQSSFYVFPDWFIPTAITFRPTEEKDYTDVLTVQFNNGISPVSFPVHGTGVSAHDPSEAGSMSLSPSSLDFGQGEIGKKYSLDMTIENTGDLPLRILGVNCPDGFATGFYDGWTIDPHSSRSFPLVFIPTREMHYFGYVTLETDTEGQKLFLYADGYGVRPARPQGASVMLEPFQIDFYDVKVGAAAARNVKLTNTGDDDLHVSAILVPESIQSNVQTVDLPPGETTTLTFRFAPPETGEYAGHIKLVSNSIKGIDELPYSGNGVTHTVSVTSVVLDKSALTLHVGEVTRLNATVLPANASDKWLFWSSSDQTVATVDGEGKVRALSKGRTVISANSPEGRTRATCEVAVVDATDGTHEGTGEENWN